MDDCIYLHTFRVIHCFDSAVTIQCGVLGLLYTLFFETYLISGS